MSLRRYNWQCDALVLGVEADFNSAHFRHSAQYQVPGSAAFFGPGQFFPETASQSLEWFGTVRGWMGLAYHNVMGYVTGGVAYSNVKNSAAITSFAPFGGFNGGGFSESDIQMGMDCRRGPRSGFGLALDLPCRGSVRQSG